MSGVDWNRSVVAIALDGREATVVSVEPVNHGMAIVKISESEDQEWYAHANGSVRDGAWVIRNVAQATETGSTAPSGGEVGPEAVERLRASHAALLDRIERNQCEHENTHRGGAIWTICEDCGERWADDRGGFQPYVAPDWLVEAREVAGALLPEPVDADEAYADALLVEQGWDGAIDIGFAAVARMIATAHRAGRSLEKGEAANG